MSEIRFIRLCAVPDPPAGFGWSYGVDRFGRLIGVPAYPRVATQALSISDAERIRGEHGREGVVEVVVGHEGYQVWRAQREAEVLQVLESGSWRGFVLEGSGSCEWLALPGDQWWLRHPELLDDGRILECDPRSEWIGDAFAANVRIIGRDGNVDVEFSVEDGVQDIQQAADGTIVVGYFDEGVFETNAHAATGAVAAFDAGGALRWRRAPCEQADLWDCYALNVDSEVWAFGPDAGFIRVSEGNSVESYRHQDYRSLDAFALAGEGFVGLSSRFEPVDGPGEPMIGWLFQRTEGETVEERAASITLEGRPCGAASFIRGRGKYLHVVVEGSWYRSGPF